MNGTPGRNALQVRFDQDAKTLTRSARSRGLTESSYGDAKIFVQTQRYDVGTFLAREPRGACEYRFRVHRGVLIAVHTNR